MDRPGGFSSGGMWKLDETCMGELEIAIGTRTRNTKALVITALPLAIRIIKIFRT
jgi:hypothetical protein